ncbi:uncharacterized protein LOC133785272 [Humulus lupulus]|uniref:uncharacterized protein LOC133785272 n=1 Tax=Humulus lupulus TaxID=3486 RepID=UPI002B403478|nr:uncharacterized protein LOC133785272 [Humulus lupulus]
MWADHEGFRETVLQSWTKPIKAHGLERIMRKLMRLKHVLRQFNRRAIGDVVHKYTVAKENYQSAQCQFQKDPHLADLQREERSTFETFSSQSRYYDSYLRQKRKINWLRFGDDNTAYFHACLKQRRATNRITSFINDAGQINEKFEDLRLMKPFTRKDVEAAMFSINSIKSPGPDGYGSGFFKVMWKDVGEEISDAILGFFYHGMLPDELNSATLSLIPKDIIKGYKRKNISPRCVMKIDLSKAYDTIDWQLLEDILNAYYFPSRFIRWVMICLKGTSYSIMMNGRLQGSFIGRKGLRQGDPISPLLFVLVMEYFTRLRIQASKSKDFRFHPNCKKLKLVSLCFADDLVYFGGLAEEDLKQILTRLQFVEGSFPLKYLGIPLRPTKWKAGDYVGIIKKIHLKLHTWSSRHLSRFLWGTNESNKNRSKMHLTAWDQICLPKSLGGIGFKEGSKWNKVLLAKFIWAISSKKDIFWVKWVDAIYLKGKNFWEYKIKTDVSWYWRKLVNLKSVITCGNLEDAIKNSKINLRKLYVQMQNKERVHFANVVWCNLAVPKHRFILCQATLGHLLTQDKLVHCHLSIASLLCPICELKQETHSHLFFDCHFSQQVRSKVASWLGIDIWLVKYEDWSSWMFGRPKGLK